jgi:hypothetical protein
MDLSLLSLLDFSFAPLGKKAVIQNVMKWIPHKSIEFPQQKLT